MELTTTAKKLSRVERGIDLVLEIIYSHDPFLRVSN